MQAKVQERSEARRLRGEGMKLDDIAARLSVAKSSVSVWVRDVPLPPPPPPPPPLRNAPVEEGTGKICGRCRRELTLESFNRAGDGRQHWCRECFKTYFENRGRLHRDQSDAARERKRAPLRRIIYGTLLSGCTDCGDLRIGVLEFDHIGEKRGSVAAMLSSGVDEVVLERELEACEVVCANCHRRRTAVRAGWFRVTGIPNPLWTGRQRRNHEHILDVLNSAACVDCGESDPVVLEFEKRANVAVLASTAMLIEVQTEIASCEVRCCNCHRLVTQERRGGTWRTRYFEDSASVV